MLVQKQRLHKKSAIENLKIMKIESILSLTWALPRGVVVGQQV
jgi:hypothetical protein